MIGVIYIMKHSSAELKQMARNNLSGKWGIAVGFTVLELLLTIVLSIITVPFSSTYTQAGIIIYFVISLIVGLLIGLLSAGSCYFYLNICRGREYGLGDLFAAFKMHPDRFLIVSLILTGIQYIFEIPVLILSFTVTDENFLYFTIISSICTIAASIVSIILSLHFALSTYLLLDFPEMGAVASLKLSAKLMRGNKGRYFYISLSFLGWILLAALSCGIGLLWVAPYSSMTFTYFYTDVLEQLDDHKKYASIDPELL